MKLKLPDEQNGWGKKDPEVNNTSEKAAAIRGLCSTCNHLPDCLHRLRNGTVIWFCEEFDDSVPPFRSERRNKREDLMGLCVGCLHGSYCQYAGELGGVWHCKYYL